ncbi:MAG: hypothetical protein ABIY70_00925 [Capsulimonas sp.]|uniref:hypothetical protein n=1 Tax=Capsulimonas sp. TaxID=2494211 RepID=UPI003265C39E
MAQAAPLQPGRGQTTILRFLGDLRRLRAPGASKRAANAPAPGRVGRSVERLARRIQTGASQTRTPAGSVSTAAGNQTPMRIFQPQALAPFASPAASPPDSVTNEANPVLPSTSDTEIWKAVSASNLSPAAVPSYLLAAPTPSAAAQTSPRGSLADHVQMRREIDISTVVPFSHRQTESGAAQRVIAEQDAAPVDLNLTLSRAPIPTVSWLGVAAPAPPIAESSASPRAGMPPASTPSMPPLAPRFSSMPADAMARSRAPSPLPTAEIMRQPLPEAPPAVTPPPVREERAGAIPVSEGAFVADFDARSISRVVEQPLAAPRSEKSNLSNAAEEKPDKPISEERGSLTPPAMTLAASPPAPAASRAVPDVIAPPVEPSIPYTPEPAAPTSEAISFDAPILRDIRIVDHVMRTLPRLSQGAPIGSLSRSPFVPAALSMLGNVERRSHPGELAPALHSPPVYRQDFTHSAPEAVMPAAPAPARLTSAPARSAAALASPSYDGFVTERPTLRARAVMPAARGAMDTRVAPEMPLPPRDRTAAAASAGTLIQRSDEGSDPAGEGGSAPSPAAPQETVAHTAEPGSGGANEVNLLANEVWSLLRRRLAYEAERMGR